MTMLFVMLLPDEYTPGSRLMKDAVLQPLRFKVSMPPESNSVTMGNGFLLKSNRLAATPVMLLENPYTVSPVRVVVEAP